MVNWRVVSIVSIIGSVILGFIGGILSYIFHHCNGCCYWTNDFVGDIMLPLSTLFVVWFIGNIPFAFICNYLENRKEKSRRWLGDEFLAKYDY